MIYTIYFIKDALKGKTIPIWRFHFASILVTIIYIVISWCNGDLGLTVEGTCSSE